MDLNALRLPLRQANRNIMAYINQPFDLHRFFKDIDQRLQKLETAVRFTAPSFDFSGGNPSNPRTGDIFFDTDSGDLKYYDGSNFITL